MIRNILVQSRPVDMVEIPYCPDGDRHHRIFDLLAAETASEAIILLDKGSRGEF